MKKLLTILTVVCVMVASVVGFALFAAADDDVADNTAYTGTIEDAVKRANAVLGATSDADITKNVKDLDTYLIENPVKPDESAEYAAMVDLVEKAAAVGALVRLNSYNRESEFVYEAHTTLNWAARTLETTPAAREYVIETLSAGNHADFVKRTEGDERKTVGDLYDELKAHFDARLEAAKQTLFDAAPLTDNNGN